MSERKPLSTCERRAVVAIVLLAVVQIAFNAWAAIHWRTGLPLIADVVPVAALIATRWIVRT